MARNTRQAGAERRLPGERLLAVYPLAHRGHQVDRGLADARAERHTYLTRRIFASEAWLASPSIVTLAEAADHWPTLRSLLAKGKVAGPMVHDAKIAALCLNHGVRELWTIDRDFGRFPGLATRNLLPGD